ncbi:MAG TPA: protein kinase, partial [Trebonia sp.]|nr:protein kinase [Trebonia sp.]
AAARTVSGVFTAMVVGADVDGPIAWLATAYVPGPSLAEAVNEHGPLPEASLLALAAGLAEALAAIHAAGVTHRDLKPSNVLLAEDGPRVIDFGISRAAESTTLTQTGLTIGSPGFMSPEQAIGTEVGPPSDIFSLGTVLAFAATGKGPFGGGTTASLLYRVVHETPDLDGVPAAVRPLIERCLVKEPAQRPTAVALLDAVGALQPTGNWLPDSVIRMAAAAPSLTPPPGQPAPTAVDGTPAPTAVPMPLVPGFAPTQTSMADFAASPPYQATEAWSTPASGSPPLAPGDPPSGTGGPRRRRSRPLVLAAVIGVLVLGGAGAAFALSSRGHTPTPTPSPAAQISSVTSTKSASVSASASPAAHKHATASASASSAHTGTTTQPASTFTATHATTSPTRTATTSPTPTTTTTTSPTPTTTTSPTPTTTTSPTATASATGSSPPASSAPSTSAVAS